MNSQIHTLLVAHHIESRLQDAADARLARDLRHRRHDPRFVLRLRPRHARVTAGA
jgi:hypothetical protein